MLSVANRMEKEMRGTWNPTRRNKNIGTKKAGHGSNNKMVIPKRFRDSRAFWEQLNVYISTTRMVNEHEIIFFIEPTNDSTAKTQS